MVSSRSETTDRKYRRRILSFHGFSGLLYSTPPPPLELTLQSHTHLLETSPVHFSGTCHHQASLLKTLSTSLSVTLPLAWTRATLRPMQRFLFLPLDRSEKSGVAKRFDPPEINNRCLSSPSLLRFSTYVSSRKFHCKTHKLISPKLCLSPLAAPHLP